MRVLNKVLWREGMHLAQHHFQAQSRYVEDTISVALGQLFPGAFGLTNLQLDRDAVRNGVAVVTQAHGILSDGLPFSMPESDALPTPREFAGVFSPTQHSHVLHLALRRYEPARANVSSSARARFVPTTHSMIDGVTGNDEAAVDLASRDFRLLLDFEVEADDVTLPLARISRDGAGKFVYDQDFIPPCTKLSGSDRLCQIVADVTARLAAKNDALVQSRGTTEDDLTSFAAHEIASFWMLHTIRSHLGQMRHHHATHETHPERLYLDMARLAGELCTFTLDATVRDIPSYDHGNPEPCFSQLAAMIGRGLETMVPTNSDRFSLVRDQPNFYWAAVPNERLYRDTAWILAVRTSTNDVSILSQVPQLVKVCARKYLPRLVQEGRAALRLHLLPAPPAAISARPGTVYFGVQLEGPCWEALRKTKEVSVYVPDVFRDVSLELFVVASA